MRSRQEFTEIIKTLKEESYMYLNDLFSGCPEEVMQTMQYVKIPKGQAILEEGMKCEYVWAVIDGEVSGADIQMPGNVYSFYEHSGINIIGDYEPFAEIAEFQKTIRAVTICDAFRIPCSAYMKWMRRDRNALLMRAQVFAYTLAREISNERKYLLLNAKDRLILYLIKTYEKREGNESFRYGNTQSQLAQHVGMNVRTVQRSIRRLAEEGFLSCRSGKIHISQQQYEKLKEYESKNLIHS